MFSTEWNRLCTRLGLKSDATNNDSNIFEFDRTSRTDIVTNRLRAKLGRELDPTKSANNHGSFYLRFGAVGN